ncbi:MAG: ABC transporter permease subunit [Trueperaceae bacterium]|nr:ABC transporter permease subunit [Trueperaceae bacterium]
MAWVVAAGALPDELMPGPVATFEFVAREIERGVLWMHLWATTRRVLVAFAFGMSAGVLLGAAMGLSRTVDRLLHGWLIAGLTVPRILLFVMSYLIFGLSDAAAVIALMVTILPTIMVQVREGTRAIDHRLVEMAEVYHRSRVSIWRRVVLPQVMPYVVGTARSSLSLAWKMVVLAELLGRTTGVGYQISFYFQMFDMVGILGYGVTMMVILAMVDLLLLGGWQRNAFRWRARSGADA